jgi:hypothetical protein
MERRFLEQRRGHRARPAPSAPCRAVGALFLAILGHAVILEHAWRRRCNAQQHCSAQRSLPARPGTF